VHGVGGAGITHWKTKWEVEGYLRDLGLPVTILRPVGFMEIAATFSRVMGRTIKFRRLPLPLARVLLGKEFYEMFKWFNQAGFEVDIPALRRDYPEVSWTSLEQWLTREGWAGKRVYARHSKTFAKIPKAA